MRNCTSIALAILGCLVCYEVTVQHPTRCLESQNKPCSSCQEDVVAQGIWRSVSAPGVRAQQAGEQDRTQQGQSQPGSSCLPSCSPSCVRAARPCPGYFKCLKIIPWAPSWLFIGAYSRKSQWGLEPCYAKSSPNTY